MVDLYAPEHLPWHYIVSYAYNRGFGRMEVFRDGPVDSFAAFKLLEHAVNEKLGGNAIILNLIPISKPRRSPLSNIARLLKGK